MDVCKLFQDVLTSIDVVFAVNEVIYYFIYAVMSYKVYIHIHTNIKGSINGYTVLYVHIFKYEWICRSIKENECHWYHTGIHVSLILILKVLMIFQSI